MGSRRANRYPLLGNKRIGMVAKKEYLNEPSWRHMDRKEPLPLDDWSKRGGGKKAFCEHCRTMKPRNSRPKVKGWKCDECYKGK